MKIEHTYANYLDAEGVDKVQALEKETGTLIMAYNTPTVAAELSTDQLKKIEELENKLCVRLVAYNTH
jgi:hypothetical protein